jgi:hypothetical protein
VARVHRRLSPFGIHTGSDPSSGLFGASGITRLEQSCCHIFTGSEGLKASTYPYENNQTRTHLEFYVSTHMRKTYTCFAETLFGVHCVAFIPQSLSRQMAEELSFLWDNLQEV